MRRVRGERSSSPVQGDEGSETVSLGAKRDMDFSRTCSMWAQECVQFPSGRIRIHAEGFDAATTRPENLRFGPSRAMMNRSRVDSKTSQRGGGWS